MTPGQEFDAAGEGRGFLLARGRYVARLAEHAGEVDAAQALRGLAFFGDPARRDADRFDTLCRHMLIEEGPGGPLVACFRLLWLDRSSEIGLSYSGQYYDLDRLRSFGGPVLELGRFCLRPGVADPDILRLAWGAITALVDRRGGRLIFGCASFRGTDPEAYAAGFAHLRGHAAPERWGIGAKAPERVGFPQSAAEPRTALRQIPPLLRTYLSMGGWVSDHAVVDREMNTLHVFTGVEVAAIPESRARALRAIAS